MILYTLLILVVVVIYIWLKKTNYWRNKGVKGPLPIPIFGNVGNVILARQSINMLAKNMYDKYPDEKFIGFYIGHSAGLLIRDPDLLQQILIRDFRFFPDRGVKVGEGGNGSNLFVAEGDAWKTLRPKFTTIFTARKLKESLPTMKKCVDDLVNYVDTLIEDNVDHEIKYLLAKYTSSGIGSCVLAIDFDVYSEEMKLLADMVNQIITPPINTRLCYLLDYIFPGIINYLPMLGDSKKLLNFFIKFANTVFSERNGKISPKKDFMDILLQLKKGGKATKIDKNCLTEIDEDVIASEVFVFYLAGFETSSTTMSFLLQELALNQEIQNRAYREICAISKKYNGEINYKSLNDLTYLKMILDETLRKHPILGIISRKSTSDYVLPGSNIKIEKGTLILIPVIGLHKEYFSDPDKFDPERFSTETNHILENTYMPFGAGPRQCIGLRFARIQSMLAIATLLKNFKIETSSKTKKEFVDDPKTVTMTQSGGIWLKISKRTL